MLDDIELTYYLDAATKLELNAAAAVYTSTCISITWSWYYLIVKFYNPIRAWVLLFDLIITFRINLFNYINSTICKFFLRQELFKSSFSISHIHTMKSFSFDLLLRRDIYSIQPS